MMLEYIDEMIMREVYVGPYDLNQDASHMDIDGGYREDRGVEDIESGLREAGIDFSFAVCIKQLAERFPGKTLEVLEGGCGYANALKDIKAIAQNLGVSLRTTGVTMARRHMGFARAAGVDSLIVGSVENAFRMSEISGPFQLVVDYFGATFYGDNRYIGDQLYLAAGTLEAYSHLVLPGGTALITNDFLNLKFAEFWNTAPRERTLGFIHELGFRIVQEGGSFALLEKQPEAV